MSVHCSEECFRLCDFCHHFNMFKSKEGTNIDGMGYCGLHKKDVDAADECKDFFCKSVGPYTMKVYKTTCVETEKDALVKS